MTIINNMIRKNKAFTLIEVMIAIFIFSILAILSMRGLQTTLMAKKRSQEILDLLEIIQQSMYSKRQVFIPSSSYSQRMMVQVNLSKW